MNKNNTTDPDFEALKKSWPHLTYWQRKKILFRMWLLVFPCRLAIWWFAMQAKLDQFIQEHKP